MSEPEKLGDLYDQLINLARLGNAGQPDEDAAIIREELAKVIQAHGAMTVMWMIGVIRNDASGNLRSMVNEIDRHFEKGKK